MERFRKYIDRELNPERAGDAVGLGAIGVVCTYLPDPVEDFDEFEFRTDYGGQNNIVITVTLELGKVKRVMFSQADGKNPDVVRGLTADQLGNLLSQKGESLVAFLEFITQ